MPAHTPRTQAQKAADSAKALAERTNKKATARAALLTVGAAALELLAADPSKDLSVAQLKGAILKLGAKPTGPKTQLQAQLGQLRGAPAAAQPLTLPAPAPPAPPPRARRAGCGAAASCRLRPAPWARGQARGGRSRVGEGGGAGGRRGQAAAPGRG